MNNKAWAAGLTAPCVLIIMWLIAPFLGFERPPVDDFRAAVAAALTLGIGGGLPAFLTWLVANK